MAASTNKKVLIAASKYQNDPIDGYIDAYVSEIQKDFQIVWLEDFVKNSDLGKEVEGALIHPSEGQKQLSEKLDQVPNLKVVANFGVGIDHVNVKLYNSRGIKVSNTPNVLNNAVADHALGLMLAAARNVVEGHRKATDPACTKWSMSGDLGVEVSETTLGIVGMGRIGMKVAQRAKAFDMKILYYNRTKRPAEEEASVGATYCSNLHDLLRESDFVVLLCPHTPDTEKLMGDAEFDAMKTTAILVNVSRGKIVDQEALFRALTSGKIYKAALDVTYPEPLPRDHKLLTLPNVTFTPHCGSATLQTRLKMLRCMLDNVKAGIEGRPLPNECTV